MDGDNIMQIRLAVTRSAPELVETTARSLLSDLNEAQPGSTSFATVPAEPGTRQVLQLTAELLVGATGVASAWLVPALQHWLSRQPADTGLIFKSGAFEVEVRGDAPPDVFIAVSQAITQVVGS